MAPANPHDTKHDLPHEGPIKTPKQLIVAVFFAFVVPIVAIILLVNYVAADHRPGAGSDGMTPEAIAQRIQPVGRVMIKDVSDPAALAGGEAVFKAQCVACHGTGALGAPKLGDNAAWAPRIASGFDTLLHSALQGKGSMPAQGGGDFVDFEIARAVVYMANQSGGKLPEPKLAPQAAQAAAVAASPAGTGTEATKAAAAAIAAVPKTQEPAAAAAGAAPALYAQSCQACHATGAAGAPKLGDKAAWAPRIAKGIDALTATAIRGVGAMPPRGGSSATDAEIKQVTGYMVEQSK